MEHDQECTGLKKLFGTTATFLQHGKTESVPIDQLEGKTVGIYFSAHWCPPCRAFTPKLAEFYKNFKQTNTNFEIVFVSSDADETAFKEYFAEMPWLALPFDNKTAKNKLSSKFKVQSIPTLVLIDNVGNLITTQGTREIAEDPKGAKFPWKPKNFWQILSSEDGKVVNNKGESFPVQDLKNVKAIGIYFSAHWCGPCRSFTPKLVKSYNAMKEANKGFEIVFASSDEDAEKWKEYFKEMPWLGIPFGDQRKIDLAKSYGIRGIPSLIIVDPSTGNTITTEGREAISDDPEGHSFPWHPKPLNELKSSTGSALNEGPCLVVLLDHCKEEDAERIKKELEVVATEVVEKQKNKDTQITFLYTKEAQMVQRFRSFFKIEDSALLVLVDLQQHRVSISKVTVDKLNTAYLKGFAEDFLKGTLSFKELED
eukprot:TRINITY_DN16798_c0_g1_i1.p1 TRINITY_DN16798_c0_g1~~TRINITY_DN16798_c0_g1_i1.p1  ORF type:complete len:440 (-),score=103.87 TRINITY_DN16798_c0_g1_i1:23-1300(-)